MTADHVIRKEEVGYITDFLDGAGAKIYGYVSVTPDAQTLTVDGNANTGATTTGLTATIFPISTTHQRRYGITARKLNLRRNVGTGNATYYLYRSVVIFDPSYYQTAISSPEPAISYQGETDWFLVGARPEKFHFAPA